MITLERYNVMTTWDNNRDIGTDVIDTKLRDVEGANMILCHCDSASLALRIAHMLNDEFKLYGDINNQMEMLVEVHRIRSLNMELPETTRNTNKNAMDAYEFVRGFIQRANNRRNLT